MLLCIPQLFQLLITINYCSNFIAWLSCLILMYICLILHVYNVHNPYMCKLWKELPPIKLAVATCDKCSGMTRKLVPRSITVCSMGPSTVRGVKVTGLCHPPPLWARDGRQRLMTPSSLPHSAVQWKIIFSSYCSLQHVFTLKAFLLVS